MIPGSVCLPVILAFGRQRQEDQILASLTLVLSCIASFRLARVTE